MIKTPKDGPPYDKDKYGNPIVKIPAPEPEHEWFDAGAKCKLFAFLAFLGFLVLLAYCPALATFSFLPFKSMLHL